VREHFTEILLCVMFLLICALVMFVSHSHNDSLASKFTEYAGQVLGALFLAMKGTSSTGGGKPPTPPVV
jgi:hypothetical protein